MKVYAETTAQSCKCLSACWSCSSLTCALVQEVKSAGLEFCPQVNGASGLWASPAAGSALGFGVGQSHLGKAWFCCFRSTGSFSGLLLDLYPKLSQFQPINLLISFPSPCGTPGKGKCHTLDVVWICVLHRWGRHLETFFSANTQEQLRLQLRYWGWDKRSSLEEKIRI